MSQAACLAQVPDGIISCRLNLSPPRKVATEGVMSGLALVLGDLRTAAAAAGDRHVNNGGRKSCSSEQC